MIKNLKYKEKITLLVLIVFLLTAVSLFFIYYTSKKNLIFEHNKRLDNTAQLTTNLLMRNVENIENTVYLFTENKTLVEYLYLTNRLGQKKEPLKELSKNIISPLNFSLLVLYDEKGDELIHVDNDDPDMKPASIKKLFYLANNKIQSGFNISEGTLRIISMGPMPYKPPVFSEDPIIDYIMIGANIDAKYLQFIKKISGNDIFILKENEILLSTQDEVSMDRISGNEMVAGKNLYSIKLVPLNSIYGKKIGTFVVALSQEDLAAALKDLKITILFLALGSILVSGFLVITLTKTLISPLRRLVKLTEEVGSGKFPEEITFKGGDEASVLGRHFLEMTKKLKDQKKALASYTTGLEDAVMKRTRELFNSREEWIRTFNSFSDYVLIVDKNMNILRANKVLLDKLNLTNQELSGKKCYEIFCGENSPPEECAVRDTLTSGRSSIKEIHYSSLHGYFMVTASPLSANEGSITGVVYVVKDITEHHDIRQKMVNSQKLASLGQMAAGFAHEINNPLTSISGCSELLLDEIETDEFKKLPQFDYFHEYLNIIYREAFRCKDIIRGMLRFSRKDFEKGTIDINSLLKEILILLEHIIKIQNIRLVEDLKCKTNSLQADEGEIRQIFLALIVNALDAMPEGGTLTLKTFNSNEGTHIIIQDTGSGITQDIKDRIFEPFFTTKPVGKGTGLGLFIVFNIIKNYNGKIELETAEKKGSTFSVTFPANDQ